VPDTPDNFLGAVFRTGRRLIFSFHASAAIKIVPWCYRIGQGGTNVLNSCKSALLAAIIGTAVLVVGFGLIFTFVPGHKKLAILNAEETLS